MIGRTLSHYRLLDRLGEGAMGCIYLAEDLQLHRRVALKVLPPELADDPDRLERFRREAQALAAVNHPNIVTVHSVEQSDGVHFITMELIEGESLDRLIAPGGLPLARLFAVAVPLAEALAAAHERGITHRDLKPANVMVTREGRVKVLDFGLARREPAVLAGGTAAVSSRAPTADGLLIGTLPYMAPEQIESRPADPRADLYAFGVLLYELATGRRPFEGSAAAVLAAILRDRPRPVRELRPELPPRLAELMERCLEKDPSRRPASTREVSEELNELARQAPSEERPARSVAVLPFVDMSPGRDQEYFCEGMAEELINALTKLPGLRVASRTSAFRFGGSDEDIRDIGRRLNVATVLEGSVRKAGERLRIIVDLVDVADGYDLWSERYDRELEDVFAIQDEIAASVVAALEVTLAPGDRQALGRAPTRVVQAYDYYLRGRNYYYQYRRQSMEFARQMFARAIEADPGFGLAYAGIADCSCFLFFNAERSEANRRQADEASRRALELAPDHAGVHASRAVALSLSGGGVEAEREFETALRLDPRLFEAAYFYARHAFALGDLEKAVRLYERAMEVRPEDYQAPLLVAQSYADLGRPAEAEAVRRRGIRAAEEHLKLYPDDSRALYMGANGLVALGETGRGLDWARRALAMDPSDPMVLYNVACIHSLAGQVDEAIACLERSVREGFTYLGWIENDSNFDPLRDHPRFLALLAGLREFHPGGA